MSTASLSSKGQLTIPSDVRADLRLNTGDRVSFEKAGDGSYRIRAVKGDIGQLAGILKYDGPPVSIDAMNEAIFDEAAAQYRRAVDR